MTLPRIQLNPVDALPSFGNPSFALVPSTPASPGISESLEWLPVFQSSL